MTEKPHKIVIEDRRYLEITGVKKVKSFDPKEIQLDTIKGNMIIKGQDLGVKNLNLEMSEIKIEGNFDHLSYSAISSESSPRVWERLFK
ncbi:MAG: sporulation protein YabP [Desulfitobacteriia bacterium]|jgi:sporulation protein YabP